MEGLLLVGHGSRLPYNRKVLEFHAKRIRDMRVFDEVKIGFLNQEPFVDKALDSMKSSRIYVVPVFISHGVHTTKDLPEMFKDSEKEIILCDPPGIDETFTEIILRMVERKK